MTMRLIDADAYEFPGDLINEPTIEAEPIKHAHWIINGDWGECSSCHEASKLSVMEHKDYCPACGAIMDEEVRADGR